MFLDAAAGRERRQMACALMAARLAQASAEDFSRALRRLEG